MLPYLVQRCHAVFVNRCDNRRLSQELCIKVVHRLGVALKKGRAQEEERE